MNEQGKKVTMWAFDCQGEMVKEGFDTEDEAEAFIKNHGLEKFKISGSGIVAAKRLVNLIIWGTDEYGFWKNTYKSITEEYANKIIDRVTHEDSEMEWIK